VTDPYGHILAFLDRTTTTTTTTTTTNTTTTTTNNNNNNINVALVHERTISTERPPFVAEVSTNFLTDSGSHVVGVTDPYGHILAFLERTTTTNNNNDVALVHERTISTERPPLVAEVSTNFLTDSGCHVVSVTDPFGRILGCLDRSHYFFFQVAPQLYYLVVNMLHQAWHLSLDDEHLRTDFPCTNRVLQPRLRELGVTRTSLNDNLCVRTLYIPPSPHVSPIL
jgi:hypothetical protein